MESDLGRLCVLLSGLFVLVKDKPRATVEQSRWVKHKNVCLYNFVVPLVGEKQFLGCHFHLVVRKDNACTVFG